MDHEHAPTTDPTSDAWSRLGRHRLRAPSGAVIDLPVPTEPASTVWVATLWPDPATPGGWARQLWRRDPTGRGWYLPAELAAGDVVEFGADIPTAIVRWYGIMDSYEVDRWATVQGPYDHPTTAHNEAQRLLDLERHAEPLRSTPEHRPEPIAQRDAYRRHLGQHRPTRRGSRPR